MCCHDIRRSCPKHEPAIAAKGDVFQGHDTRACRRRVHVMDQFRPTSARFARKRGLKGDPGNRFVIPDKCSASSALIRKPDVFRVEDAAVH